MLIRLRWICPLSLGIERNPADRQKKRDHCGADRKPPSGISVATRADERNARPTA